MFQLSPILAASVPASRAPRGSDDPLLAELAGREYRFHMPAVPPARLPRDSQSISDLWTLISGYAEDVAEPGWATVVWSALTTPGSPIPLTPRENAGQEFAAVGVVDLPGHSPAMAIVRITIAARTSKFAQPRIIDADARVLTELDLMAEDLEKLYMDALPQARATAARSATRALWLGGDHTVTATDNAWRQRVEASGAVMGLRTEIIEEPTRRISKIEATLGSVGPPAYLLVWQPMSRGSERLVSKFQQLRADGEVVLLREAKFTDVLLEARLGLMELGLARTPHTSEISDNRQAPTPGEERFYIKVGGATTGDVLIRVLDCGHRRWGSDARRKAPRATMGVKALEGVLPKALFRCSSCTKHRWRARF